MLNEFEESTYSVGLAIASTPKTFKTDKTDWNVISCKWLKVPHDHQLQH